MSIDPENTARLKLPFIMPSQAQKHVTHNEALRLLDALVQPGVLDRDLAAPPATPQEGDQYIVGPGASGEWEGKENHFAAFMDGAWFLLPPVMGMTAYIADEARQVVWNGTAWVDTAGQDFQNLELERVGVGTAPDAANPFAAKLGNALWTANYGDEGGTGDLRFKMNKEAAGNTVSVLFQTNWSGRAEFGLTGSEDFAIKVSPDGSSWKEALTADRNSGTLYLPNGIRLGSNTAANELDDYQEGRWTPEWAELANGDLTGATGISVAYGYYVKVGSLVTLHCGFDVTGLTAATFTQKSALSLSALPFTPRDEGGNIDMGGVSGFVYQTIGGRQTSLVSGGVSGGGDGRIHLFVFYTGNIEARNTDRFHICVTYLTDQ